MLKILLFLQIVKVLEQILDNIFSVPMFKGQDCYPPEATTEVTVCDPGSKSKV